MAELNWIVPARRAVVMEPAAEGRRRRSSSPISWEDAHTAWLAQVEEHLSTLASWYAPLDASGRGSSAISEVITNLLEDARAWRPGEPGIPCQQSTGGRATTGDGTSAATPARVELNVRLWKGPLRVLAEQATDDSPTSRAAAADERTVQTSIGDTQLSLQINANGEVLNEDADFVPGDVLEFPFFKLLWAAGISRFVGTSFNPGGSFFLGTSVRDAAGNSPGTVWLHDNMIAMRFQLLLNCAQGSYPSFRQHFHDDYRRGHQHSAELFGRTVYSRGMLYAGSFANPAQRLRTPRHRRGQPEPQAPVRDRYIFQDWHWGISRQVPEKTAADSMRAEGWRRITWGWACTPCALTLAYYMLAQPGWVRGGSVNSHAREMIDDREIVRASHQDYFHNRVFARRTSVAEVTSNLVRRAGGPANAGLPWIRRKAFDQLFGRQTEDESEHDDDEPSTAPSGQGTQRLNEEQQDSLIAMEAPESEDAAPEAEGYDGNADAIVGVGHARDLPATGDEQEFTLQQMRDYLSHSFTSVGLNGHEYSYVYVRKHGLLIDLPAERPEMGTGGSSPPNGPPVAGFMAAYDMLSGRSYATTDEGDIYIHEATGRFNPSNVNFERCGVTVFTARSHRWERVEHFRFKQSTRGVIYIGDQSRGTRGKHLTSITRFDEDAVMVHHARPQAYLAIAFHSRGRHCPPPSGQTERINLDEHMFDEWYAFRAVPYPTGEEADTHDIYPSLRDTLSNLDSLSSPGSGTRHTLRNAVEQSRSDGLSPWGQNLVRARIGSYARQTARAEAMLRGQAASRPRQVASLIRRLQRRVRRRGRSDADTAVVAHQDRVQRTEIAPLEAALAPHRRRYAQLLAQRQEQYQLARANEARGVSSNPQWREMRRLRDEARSVRQSMGRDASRLERIRRRNPELELVPLLAERNRAAYRPPPTATEFRAQAEEQVFATWDRRWRRIVHLMGGNVRPHTE